MSQQPHTTNSAIMCRPFHFGFNEQTNKDNAFQHKPEGTALKVQSQAFDEFESAASKLSQAGVNILILEHEPTLKIPDAVFPNNWFTTHADGSVKLYPMKTENRRQEVTPKRLKDLLLNSGYQVECIEIVNDSVGFDGILEGTGAVVFDHHSNKAYAAISERCEESIFMEYCRHYNWSPIAFQATGSTGQPIYHTNVMLSIGNKFAVVCGASISKPQRNQVMEQLQQNHLHVIDISLQQAETMFCANILELQNQQGDPVIAMSETAFNGFTTEQKSKLSACGDIVACKIPTIEHIGGGSMRCMLAENFLPKVK